MKTIFLLEQDDIIDDNTYCRPLVIEQNPWSDRVFFQSVYGGSPINNFKWVQVGRIMPAYIGKRVSEVTFFPYEFVKGDISSDHILQLTDVEKQNIYDEYLSHEFMKQSKKHAGKTLMQIKNSDPSYFDWACDQRLIVSYKSFCRNNLIDYPDIEWSNDRNTEGDTNDDEYDDEYDDDDL